MATETSAPSGLRNDQRPERSHPPEWTHRLAREDSSRLAQAEGRSRTLPRRSWSFLPTSGHTSHQSTKWETLITRVPVCAPLFPRRGYQKGKCGGWSAGGTQSSLYARVTCEAVAARSCTCFRRGTELLKQVVSRAVFFYSNSLGDSTSHAAKNTSFLVHFAFEARYHFHSF